jgi:hypothetical protein
LKTILVLPGFAWFKKLEHTRRGTSAPRCRHQEVPERDPGFSGQKKNRNSTVFFCKEELTDMKINALDVLQNPRFYMINEKSMSLIIWTISQKEGGVTYLYGRR